MAALRTLRARELATAAHALASIGMIAPLSRAVASADLEQGGGGVGQGVGQGLGQGVGQGRERPWEKLWAPLAEAAVARIQSCNAQELSNLAWAFAKARCETPTLFPAILHDFRPQELAVVAWAFATAGHNAPALFEGIAAEVVAPRRLKSFRSQELSNTAWAFATANHRATALFDALAVEASSRLAR